MKMNIKMRVTPEQSVKVQKICFDNGIEWSSNQNIRNIKSRFIYIDNNYLWHSFSGDEYSNEEVNEYICFFYNQPEEEVDADLFIRTNGTCEETQKPSYRKTKILNQKKELHKLNLKLQKCISLEEHRKVINWHIERNKSLFAEIDNLKAENIEMGKLVNLNKSALDLAVMTKDLAMNEIERKNNEIEKLKAVIEYLESKAK